MRDATDRIVGRTVNGTILARYGFTGSDDAADLTLDVNNNVIQRTVTLPGGVLLTKQTVSPGDVWSYPNIHGDVITTPAGTPGTRSPARELRTVLRSRPTCRAMAEMFQTLVPSKHESPRLPSV